MIGGREPVAAILSYEEGTVSLTAVSRGHIDTGFIAMVAVAGIEPVN